MIYMPPSFSKYIPYELVTINIVTETLFSTNLTLLISGYPKENEKDK